MSLLGIASLKRDDCISRRGLIEIECKIRLAMCSLKPIQEGNRRG